MKFRLASALLLVLIFPGCIQSIAIHSVGGILDFGFQAFNEESDLEIGRSALASNLKLVEALIKADPGNEKLMLYAAQGFDAYALAFAEDDSAQRARALYARAKEYGLEALEKRGVPRAKVEGDEAGLRQALGELSIDDVPAVFWTALSWGSYINVSRDQTSAVADLPNVKAMMEFVMSKDSTYYYGGAPLFFGTVEAITPQALGGKPERAKDFFERALAINGGKFLLTYVYYAKTYCVQTLHQEMFDSLLNKVDQASIDVLPEARFANAVAKQKSKALRARESELF